MEYSRVRYLPPKLKDNTIHWTGELVWPGGNFASVTFEFTCPDAGAFVPRARPFLLAFLLPAMRIGLPLHLEQPIDQTTFDNLMEWQCALACWVPHQLKVVPLRCSIEPEPAKSAAAARRGALTAFSGGVDSCFTAFRNTTAVDAGLDRRVRLGAGLMVHGFDIPEAQAEVFDRAFKMSEQVLQSLGLQSYRMRTNLRSLSESIAGDWEYEVHGIWLAAALACLEPFFDRVLIPSTYSYELLKLPWGSNPVTDVYLGSETTPYWHDGAAWHKLAKVQAIAQQPAIQRGLRVCWEGAQLDRNCGRCFKCIATQVCFWLSGVKHAECFPVVCSFDDVGRARLKNEQNRHLFQVLHQEAKRQHQAGLMRALASALARNTRQRLRRKIRSLLPTTRKSESPHECRTSSY